MEKLKKMKFVTNFLFLFTLINLAKASDFSGNLKSYPILKENALTSTEERLWQNSFKLQHTYTFSKEFKTEVAYELTTLTALHRPHLTTAPSYRFDDLKTYLHDEQNPAHYETILTQNLNRLNFSWSNPLFDVTVGRQPIAFGSAKSINPTDVLTPFAINSIDKEDRVGVDAVNIKAPLNATSLVEAGFVAGEKLESDKNAFYIRPKFNFQGFDLSLTAMNFKKRKLYGMDIQHPLWDAGTWLEMGVIDESNPALKDYLRLTYGVEYKFQSSLYLAMEYHYNGASLNDKKINPSEFVFLQNFNYFILTSSYEITPLLMGTLQTYFNSKDQSVFSIAKLEYNLSENSYVGLGTFAGFGNSKNTEFGKYGKVYFASIRYYF